MHGRLKVRTSAEEALRKKKEQDLKAKAYRNGMDKILAMRSKAEFDQPLLDLSAKILSVNPDLNTLWNIRRECILKMTENDKENTVLFDRDLGFTENCLQIQPKSYGAWHHRIWILENCPVADWNREVELCTRYLRKDERNFHCWDYRRFVAAKANISADNEFKFCEDKIQKNFSNYSSWFYRSQLLPILHPHETEKSRPISESKLKEELELVITAAFTDPNDSSAWFYQRWLLGYSDQALDFAAFKCTKDYAVVSFTKPINLNDGIIKIKSDGIPEMSMNEWKSIGGNTFDTIWILEKQLNITNTEDFIISLDVDEITHELNVKKVEDSYIGIKMPKFGYEFGAAVMEELNSQLDSCNQLLEFEPDSKWTLLTASLLMRSIDRFKYHEKTVEFLRKLETVDNLRAGYYKDLASKWSVEVKLKDWIEEKNYESGTINLSALELTTVYYNQYLTIANHVDLSGNPELNESSCKFSKVSGCK
ncbi:unnamed protein product, partial [Diamesa hyperborea]